MEKLPYRAVISDLDGTLLNSDHILDKFSVQVLNKLERKNVDIVLATGRSHTDVSSILGKLETQNAAMITSNGAKIHDLKGNLLYSNCISPEIATALYQTPFDPQRICLNTYQEGEWFINVDVPEMKKYHQDSGFMYQVVDFNHHHQRDVEKVFFIGKEPQDLLPVEDYLRRHFSETTTIVYSSLKSIEVMNKGVSKGNALKHLLSLRSYGLADCIAFGDGMNDVEMLNYVGKGCVMGNADERLKRACPHLEQIGFNQDEAVARYLENTFGV